MNPSQARSTSGRLAAGAVLLGAGIGLAAGGPITGTALAAGAGAAALAASKRRGGDGDGGGEEEGEEEEEEEVTAVAEAAKEVVVEPEPLAPLRPLEHYHAVKGGRCRSSAPVSTASEGGAAEVLEAPALAPAPNKMRAAATASCARAGSGGGGDADLLRLHLQLMPSATKGGHDAVRVRVAWLCD